MYCSTCATPLAAGLSYCNRCGANLKEREDPKAGTVAAYLTTIALVGLGGLGLMLGGAIKLKNAGQFHEELIGIYMVMTFFIVALIEFFLCRQLSSVIKSQTAAAQLPKMPMEFHDPTNRFGPAELRAPQARALPDPIPSVTENTTRTLGYSHNEPTR